MDNQRNYGEDVTYVVPHELSSMILMDSNGVAGDKYNSGNVMVSNYAVTI